MKVSVFNPLLIVVVMVLRAGSTSADVFNMRSGLTNLEIVPVGNPGNAADTKVMDTDITTGYGSVDHNYNIGKYEVTAGQYTEFLNAVAAEDTYGLYSVYMSDPVNCWGCNIQRNGISGNYIYSVPSDWANRPVNHVSWADAARFTNWLHNGQPNGIQNLSTTEDGAYNLNGAMTWEQIATVTRKSDAKWWIPTENEWYKAAYYDPNKPGGAGYWDYPTGTNNALSNLLTKPDSGNTATFRDRDGNYTIGSPYHWTEVGAHENSKSPYGTYDQGGNLWEWNEAIIDLGGSNWIARGSRGGCAGNYSNNLLSSDRNFGYPTNDYNDSMGFRVACVPEPGSLLMIVMITLVGLIYLRQNRKTV
jgi:formylglycine-generating enzyme